MRGFSGFSSRGGAASINRFVNSTISEPSTHEAGQRITVSGTMPHCLIPPAVPILACRPLPLPGHMTRSEPSTAVSSGVRRRSVLSSDNSIRMYPGLCWRNLSVRADEIAVLPAGVIVTNSPVIDRPPLPPLG